MKFYFSGIGDKSTYALLERAGVENILVDQTDAKNIPLGRKIGILDSGAYRLFKKNQQIDFRSYVQALAVWHSRCELIVAPDVILDPEQTYLNWQAIKDAPLVRDKLIPVWQWQAPTAHLEEYLQEAKVVGVGGLAKIMRAGDKTKEEKSLREKTLKELGELCAKFPGRFHLFGLNYPKAIEQLAPFAYSSDSSFWMRGRKYRYIIFQHSINKHLTQAPARAIPEYKNLEPDELCVLSAQNIERFLDEVSAGEIKKAA